MPSSPDRLDDMAFGIGTLGNRVAQERHGLGVEFVIRIGFITLELRRELVSMSKDFVNGTGHSDHLRKFLSGRHRVYDNVHEASLDVPNFEEDRRAVRPNDHHESVAEIPHSNRIPIHVDDVLFAHGVLERRRRDYEVIHDHKVTCNLGVGKRLAVETHGAPALAWRKA